MKLPKLSTLLIACVFCMGIFSFPLSAKNCHRTKKFKSKSTNWSFNFDLNPFTLLCSDRCVAQPTYVRPVVINQPQYVPVVEQVYYPAYSQQVIVQQPTYIQRTYTAQPQVIYW